MERRRLGLWNVGDGSVVPLRVTSNRNQQRCHWRLRPCSRNATWRKSDKKRRREPSIAEGMIMPTGLVNADEIFDENGR